MLQREMPVMGETRKMAWVSDDLMAQCRHRLDAIRLCIQLSGLSHEFIGSQLNIDKGHLSRIMQGKAHFPDSKSTALMELCGNYAPMQYEMRHFHINAHPKRRSTDWGGRRGQEMRATA